MSPDELLFRLADVRTNTPAFFDEIATNLALGGTIGDLTGLDEHCRIRSRHLSEMAAALDTPEARAAFLPSFISETAQFLVDARAAIDSVRSQAVARLPIDASGIVGARKRKADGGGYEDAPGFSDRQAVEDIMRTPVSGDESALIATMQAAAVAIRPAVVEAPE